MWQEARKQEKAIRGMMIDFQKRAERRKLFYERMHQDPIQMIRMIGSRCTIHLDPMIASAAENPKNMIPWQGDHEVLIDKYDARQWLDFIPETSLSRENDDGDIDPEEQKFNYERYRTLVQSDFLQITEEQRLEQMRMEEALGKSQVAATSKAEKQKLANKKAAIGYSYGDTPQPVQILPKETEELESESDEDFDLVVKMDSLTKSQIEELNAYAQQYGIARGEFFRMLKHDRADYDAEEAIKEFEEIRKNLSGRKAKKQRRLERDKRRKRRRVDSPVSYAKRSSPSYEPYKASSESSSLEDTGKVEFITEFGGDSKKAEKGSANLPLHKVKKYRHRRSSSSSSELSSSDYGHSHSRKSHHHRSNSHDHSRHRQRTSRDSRSQRNRHGHREKLRSRSRSSSSRDRDYDKQSRHSRRSRRSESRDSSRSRSRSSHSTNRKESKKSSELELKTKALAKAPKQSTAKKLTPQEKLKKRMQIMLNKQFKSDKVKEQEKEQQKELERKEREEDLRELTRLYREKANRDGDDDWFDWRYRRSRSLSPSPRGSSRNESRSRSPHPARYR
ncbi:CLK4-associating serine/arginine rich protein-like [Corticium candelabrum]|uniref:CLK4-associating serine/arginine rich protein-like n=1 Tax=Corticium candelabrum TaxID=121492 RepID=UPI002E252B70|nr:CLK4-associating serine/arginine rich protein-like [Corticium candelabrum]